ncbi:DUF1467 family protein [Sphingomonas qomolangmaensis]|uniref:DUF1467 family protein n=1 Tax=Sphingomonas qomolangmaensis TaxID=2918765 RepID=A0ABY5LBT4_9SPHN|nr:DUF1467 family protein [Sphingomonas qomolangmaensis]UUL83312.1 DUF1467 family protein [Sphingomonas qomolangmaensis]
MAWQSAMAIYFLFWALSVFFVLPFGVQTTDEAGIDRIPGQADSAPTHFNVGRVALLTTIVSAMLFGAFYANYVNGWVTAEMLDFVNARGR